ncbi:right-handed parallel beta-helix repeat-containing protein [Candidatus Woesearchaeota archaeon]|nr:right-handed parallel beta-helix repeat-containing protein [Candidatus Woesearchaeota archaeon]
MPDSEKPGNLEEQLRRLRIKKAGKGLENLEGLLRKVDPADRTGLDPRDVEATLRLVNSRVPLPKGCYHIDFGVTITPGGVLKIEAGTQIYLGPSAYILSAGSLIAHETEFVPSEPDVGWGNITLTGGEASGSILEHCTIKGGRGRQFIQGSEYFEAFPPEDIPACGTRGGALLIVDAKPTIRHCVIADSEAYSYGGGVALYFSDAVLEDNEITGNSAQWGGGMEICESDPALIRNIIKENVAVLSGGGINICPQSRPTLEENKIMYNKATGLEGGAGLGGGLYLSGETCRPVLVRNTIVGNIAIMGGGMYVLASNITKVAGNTIEGNKPDNIMRARTP